MAAQPGQPMDTLTHAAQQHLGDARHHAATMRAALTRFDLAMAALAAITVPQTAGMRRRASTTTRAPRAPRQRVTSATVTPPAAAPTTPPVRQRPPQCVDCPRYVSHPLDAPRCTECAADFRYRYQGMLPICTVVESACVNGVWYVTDDRGQIVRSYESTNARHWAAADCARRNAAYARHAQAVRTSGYTPRPYTD